MKLSQYHQLHRDCIISIPKSREHNNIPSATDPTQDCPVSAFVFDGAGNVVNCRPNGLPFSGVPIEQMSSIESRHRDPFDVLGEQQKLASRASRGLRGSKQKKLIQPLKTD